MFGSLVRWFGEKGSTHSAERFLPALEGLELRANPGGRGGIGGELLYGQGAVVMVRPIGEEISQVSAGAQATAGSTSITAEAVWVGGPSPHGADVNPFGSRGGISGEV